MEEKKLYHFGAWAGFVMALMLILNGVSTFIPSAWLHWISRIGFVLAGFGVLPAIWRQIKEHEAGWATWLTALAYLGLAAEGLLYIGQASLNSNWLLFGGLAAWAVGMNAIGIRSKRWPLGLGLLGIVSGLLLFAAVVANSIQPGNIVNLISAGLGAVALYPAWLIWMGIRMLKGK
ncbi:MAG: hypothetical protein FD146_2563 [Anaerolineaceae bacterium]|nr:MAG: hypothetical protein FD146_2563 [Anaerolineaceae bacterium]